MIQAMKSVDFDKIIDSSFIELSEKILDLNKEQLLAGQTSTGEMLRPKYTEDPYFKNRGAAVRYAIWKKGLEDSGQIPKSRYGTKYFTAPNLFIKGTLHGNMRIRPDGQYLDFDADGFGSGFDQKYKNMYGLQDQGIEEINPKLLESITKKYREQIKI